MSAPQPIKTETSGEEINGLTITEPSTEKTSIPQEVKTTSESGVEDGALELAKKFLESQGQLARKCNRRGELSHLYISTQGSWMDEDTRNDESLQRPFKQILFALAHGHNL